MLYIKLQVFLDCRLVAHCHGLWREHWMVIVSTRKENKNSYLIVLDPSLASKSDFYLTKFCSKSVFQVHFFSKQETRKKFSNNVKLLKWTNFCRETIDSKLSQIFCKSKSHGSQKYDDVFQCFSKCLELLCCWLFHLMWNWVTPLILSTGQTGCSNSNWLSRTCSRGLADHSLLDP